MASGLFCKCERRRCLRIVEKVSQAPEVDQGLPQSLAFMALTPDVTPPASLQSQGCGMCRGCQTQEDCGHCRVCLRPPRSGLKRQWRCVQRRCFWVSQAGVNSAGGANTIKFTTTAAVASSQSGFAFLILIFFSISCSPPWFCLPALLCQHLAHRFRDHPHGCQLCPPRVVVSPAVSA